MANPKLKLSGSGSYDLDDNSRMNSKKPLVNHVHRWGINNPDPDPKDPVLGQMWLSVFGDE